MLRFWSRLQLSFLGIFLAVSASIFIYQAIFVWPVEHCEAQGGWWAPKYHQCAQPVRVWQFTGRAPATLPIPVAPKPH
jgi:hypothetical protein